MASTERYRLSVSPVNTKLVRITLARPLPPRTPVVNAFVLR